MVSFLLDTNVIIDVLRQRRDRHLLIGELLNQGHPLASCPVTLTEIYAGMRANEETATRAFMNSLLFLPVTAEIAERAGHLKAQYARRGTSLAFQDVTIAAVCMAYGCTLVTENVRDFPMPDLILYPLLARTKKP